MMMTTRKTSSRNQRANKGMKWKHVLQICLLVGVCVWLIYQVKYSHDKKKAFYEKDAGASTTAGHGEVAKLGRKDLPLPRSRVVIGNEDGDDAGDEEIIRRGEEEEEEDEMKKSEAVNDHPDDEREEPEEEEEEEENKRGEEDETDEEENKHEGDDNGGGDVEDDIDEHDQGKAGETDREDDETMEEEKERGEDNVPEETDTTVHEAREEHYKGDDASSAVSHESHADNNTGKIGLAEGKGESFGSDTRREAGPGLEGSGLVQNRSESEVDPRQEHNGTEPVITPGGQILSITVASNRTKEDSMEAQSLNTGSDSVVPEKIKLANATEAKENAGSYDGSGNKESSELSFTEERNGKVDRSGNTNSREEKEVLTEPVGLPRIRTEVVGDDGVAAE